MSSEQPLKTTVPEASTPPSNNAEVKRVSHQTVIEDGLAEDDVPAVKRGLELAESRKRKDAKLLSSTLAKCVTSGSLQVAQYLLTEEQAPLSRVSPELLLQCPVKAIPEILGSLVDNGWDINQNDEAAGGGVGRSTLKHLCNNEDMVRWCLDHGAKVEDVNIDPYYNPPLLECVARNGTVATFKLLQSHGAKLTPRTLHQAVDTAGVSGGHRFEMVKYLVEDQKLDVNALDDGEGRPNFWGTPLCYAAHFPSGGKDVVQYLLDHGANPSIKNTRGDSDALSIAKSSKNEEVVAVLEAWKGNNLPS